MKNNKKKENYSIIKKNDTKEGKKYGCKKKTTNRS